MQALPKAITVKRDLTEALCNDPLWQDKDLGKAIPDSPHAVSVAMPLWKHVVGYEEGDPEVVDAFHSGYPRFFFHPLVAKVLAQCEAQFAKDGERCLALTSARSAEQAADFIREQGEAPVRIESLGSHGVHVIAFPEDVFDVAKRCWEHYGAGISSRLAETILEGAPVPQGGDEAKATLRSRIAGWAEDGQEQVSLYPTGMAALAQSLRIVQGRTPGAKTIQLGFPYVDLLRIQQCSPNGLHFFHEVSEATIDAVAEIVANEPIAGVFCEAPGNPLLTTPNVPRLSAILRERNVPLVVDETLGTFANIDVRPYADILMTSLTKYVSGVGDAMGGSLILNSASPLLDDLSPYHKKYYEDLLWDGDALTLEENSRDFTYRIKEINGRAEDLCEALMGHTAVEKVYFPKYITAENYHAIRRPTGGFGGLFSITLKGGLERTKIFYDRLRLCKGPSLGMNYSLACPFVFLAHYEELDWVRSMDISPYLIRVSTGLEDAADLVERFEEALR
jgi:cystathionine gamma-synthase